MIHSDSFGCVSRQANWATALSRRSPGWTRLGGSFQWETTWFWRWFMVVYWWGFSWLRISCFLFRGASKVLGCEKLHLFKSPGEPAGESVGKNDSRMQMDLLLNSHGTMASAPQMARTDPNGRLPESPWVFPRHALLIPKISTRMLDDYLAMGHNWVPRLLDGNPLVI